VPCYIYAPGVPLKLNLDVEHPSLANVAATSLQLLGFSAPEGYEPGLLSW